jgi:glc operon protein GlcG
MRETSGEVDRSKSIDVRAAHQTPTHPPAPPLGTPISAEQARKVAGAARDAASGIGVPNAIAIVEPSGDLVYFLKMDGAPYSATQLAQKKAVTSARYRRPTQAFFDAVEGGHPFFLTFPDVVAAPGGTPIVSQGKLIGAIGVSGGNADQDVAVCNAGAAALA